MRRIAQETINRVLEEVDIFEVVSQYVDLKKRGKNYFGLSPFRSETKPSFSVAPDKNMWYDFGSGQGGNAVQFLIEYEKISFSEAIRSLAEKHNIEIIEVGDEQQSNLYDQLYEIHNLANLFFINNLSSKKGIKAKSYMKDRFFDDTIIKKFSIGFASDAWDELYNELKDKFDNEVIEKSGLFSKGKKGYLDRFRNRIMFPFFSPSGKVIGFSGRSLSEKEDVKYLNSPETLLFQKSKVFYGSYQTMPEIRKQNYVLLVEGQTDFLRLYEKGFTNVLATSGTAFSSKHAAALNKYTNRVILTYDSDNAGINAAIRTGYILMQNGFEVRVLDLGNDLDPDDYFKLKENNNNSFKKLIKEAVHPINYIIIKKNILSKGASDRSKFLNESIEEIKLVKDVIIRNDLIKRLSNELGVVESEILDRFDQITSRKISASKATDSEEAPIRNFDSKSDIAQLEILKLLIHNPSLADEINISLFDNKLCYNIVKSIKDNRGSYNNVAQLLEFIGDSPEERNLVAALAVDRPEKENELIILNDCIKTLEDISIKKEISQIRNQIRIAEDNNQDLDTNLLRKLETLQKKVS
ncbi:MAG: DNA primase [Candidatus Neomarinimicrobiota bacterium]|jgi:DNA primase